MQRRTFLTLALAGTGLALAGCGFRLRGLDDVGDLALAELALAGPDSDLARLTRERLEAGGTQVHAGAARVLNLGPEDFRQRRLGVLDTGPQDEEMTLVVLFSVQRRRDGAYLVGQQPLEATTRYRVSEGDLLTQDDRRAEARHELRQAVLRQLMDRLQRLPDTE